MCRFKEERGGEGREVCTGEGIEEIYEGEGKCEEKGGNRTEGERVRGSCRKESKIREREETGREGGLGQEGKIKGKQKNGRTGKGRTGAMKIKGG